MRPNVGNVGLVVRLHGELFGALAQFAKGKGLKPATALAHGLEEETWALPSAGGLLDREYGVHAYTEAYLPTHNPHVTEKERAKKVKLTVQPSVLGRIRTQAVCDLAQRGQPEPARFGDFVRMPPERQKQLDNYPACRNYLRALQKREKEILVSCVLHYLERQGVVLL